MFIQKLRQCQKIIGSSNKELYVIKHNILFQLLNFINNNNNVYPLEVMPDFILSFSLNVFRQQIATYPKYLYEINMLYDEPQPYVDQQFYHLQFFYEMLLRFVYSTGGQTQNNQQQLYKQNAKQFLNQDFIMKLCQLFVLADARERDYIKTIIHRIYANLLQQRNFIKNQLKQILFNFLLPYQTNYCIKFPYRILPGASDILEILGSIINGFAKPLKQEHIIFLQESLIQLQKSKDIKQFIPQLSFCYSKYIEKDPLCGEIILQQILQYFPRNDSSKQMLFLSQIIELFDVFYYNNNNSIQNQYVIQLTIERISQLINQTNFQLSEKALQFLQSQTFQRILKDDQNKKQHLEDLFVSLKANRSHWNVNVRFLSQQAMQIIQQVDETVKYEEIGKQMLKQSLLRQLNNEINEGYQIQASQMALENLKNDQYLQQYFKKRNVNLEFGKQIIEDNQIIQPNKIIFSQVALDSIYEQQTSMILNTLELSQETIISALDGAIQQLYNLSDKDNLTFIQQIIENQQNYNKEQISDISSQILIQKKLVDLEKVGKISNEFYGYTSNQQQQTQQNNTNQIRNRRASAGITNQIGIRRKSIIPLSQHLEEIEAQLQSYQRHIIN